jgi:hypothetical protein
MMIGSYEIKTYTIKLPNQKRIINPEHEKFQTHTMNPDYGEILTEFTQELGFVRDHSVPPFNPEHETFLFRHTKDNDLQVCMIEGTKTIYVSHLDKEIVMQLEFYETPVDPDRTMLRLVDFVNGMLIAIRDMYR